MAFKNAYIYELILIFMFIIFDAAFRFFEFETDSQYDA